MTLTRAKVRQLATIAWRLMDADALDQTHQVKCIDIIEQMILAAIKEYDSGEPSEAMLDAGFEHMDYDDSPNDHADANNRRNAGHVFRAMSAARLREMLGEDV